MMGPYFPDPRVRQRFYEFPPAVCLDDFPEQLFSVVPNRLLLCRVSYALDPDDHWI